MMNQLKHTWLVLLFCSPAAALAQPQPQPPQPPQPVVVTVGEGVVKRAPDRAWVGIAAETRAKTPREAQKANADAMNAVMQKLKTLGFAGEAIRTTTYDLQPEFDYHDGRQTLRGYLARNAIEVRVDAIDRVGEVLDAAVGSGASSVRGVRFDIKDREEAEREALKRAVADARARADAAAAGAGVRIERVVRIEEHRGMGPEPPRPLMRTMVAQEMAAAEPPVSPGEMEVRVIVTMTAAIR